jgi:ribokinase
MSGAPAIAVVGSINIDIVAEAARPPRPGETVPGDNGRMTLGGKGANQAVALARLGADVRLIAMTGDDVLGRDARARLLACGVSLGTVGTVSDRLTGMALITLGRDGENAITVASGANAALSPAVVEGARDRLAGVAALLVQNEIPPAASLAAMRMVRATGGLVIHDPAPALPPDRELFAAADIVTPNETETEFLTGIRPVDDRSVALALAGLLELGCRTALVKLGERGVAFAGERGEGRVPAFPTPVVDTVAAGDCFNAALAFALVEGRSLGTAARFAAAAASVAVGRKGAGEAAATHPEILARLNAPA